MKKVISILSLVFVVGVLSANAQCCSSKKSASACDSKTSTCDSTKTACAKAKTECGAQAYYFHGTRRCVTCESVEEVTKQALKEYYGDKITFASINREEEKENPMIKRYKVSGQTLLIVKGDKVVDLTNFAFMNARTNPAKLKEKIKVTIDSMI